MFIDTEDSRKYAVAGARFQLPMILLWGLRGIPIELNRLTLVFNNPTQEFTKASLLSMAGYIIMGTCMVRIYHNKTGSLLTKDLFALTRHPMYHGMYLVDLALFFKSDLSSMWFWISWVVFTILIFAAGWYQEKETLARWGDEAKRYYERTPRFIFEWLWFRRKP
ncbi:MAG: hypothetical protein RLZZ480_637 [Candidatus Parcubacteria bacterium]|jgi:hypothetical protein